MDSAEFEIEESSEIDESSSDFGSLGALAPAWREGDAISLLDCPVPADERNGQNTAEALKAGIVPNEALRAPYRAVRAESGAVPHKADH